MQLNGKKLQSGESSVTLYLSYVYSGTHFNHWTMNPLFSEKYFSNNIAQSKRRQQALTSLDRDTVCYS